MDNSKDIENLKYWLDAELTMIHIGFYIVLGILIGGMFWFVVGVLIAISLAYMIKRLLKLPKDYLKVK
jgi:hypothetical protein